MNNKVGTDQAVGYTAWHADTRRERLQQGFDLIVCYVRPHLRLRLGAATVGPVLVGLVGTAAGIDPAGLVALAALEAVFQRGASTWVTVLAVWVTPVGGGSDLRVTILFCFVSQCRAAVGVACSVALGNKRQQKNGFATASNKKKNIYETTHSTERFNRNKTMPQSQIKSPQTRRLLTLIRGRT